MLEDHLPTSRYQQPGERVVQGQRLMQAASDIFLGWTKGVESSTLLLAPAPRHEGLGRDRGHVTDRMTFYAGVCGWTLARAHARSGDPVAIAAYLGGDDRFDRAMADFAERYADQNERDYEAFASPRSDPDGSRLWKASELRHEGRGEADEPCPGWGSNPHALSGRRF